MSDRQNRSACAHGPAVFADELHCSFQPKRFESAHSHALKTAVEDSGMLACGLCPVSHPVGGAAAEGGQSFQGRLVITGQQRFQHMPFHGHPRWDLAVRHPGPQPRQPPPARGVPPGPRRGPVWPSLADPARATDQKVAAVLYPHGRPTSAPDPAGKRGNHGEANRARRSCITAVRPGQCPTRLQMIAASQAEGFDAVVLGRLGRSPAVAMPVISGRSPGYAGGRGDVSHPAAGATAQRWLSRNSRTSAVIIGPVPCATTFPSFSRT